MAALLIIPSPYVCIPRGISAQVQAERIADQLAHIRNMLETALAAQFYAGNETLIDWIVVAGHYPVFSSGEHGDTDELVTYLWPLLLEFGVDAYLCGHDHISEHLR